MRRREALALFGGAAAWPLAARAQQAPMPLPVPLVGFLRSTPSEPFADLVASFREGMKEAGYIEGTNVAVEYRFADDDVARLPSLAFDLISRQPAVIVGNALAVRAIRELSESVPIVFVLGGDPVTRGFVVSLNKPGGNTTGVTFFGGGSLDVKRLELLHELIPRGQAVAVLLDR